MYCTAILDISELNKPLIYVWGNNYFVGKASTALRTHLPISTHADKQKSDIIPPSYLTLQSTISPTQRAKAGK